MNVVTLSPSLGLLEVSPKPGQGPFRDRVDTRMGWSDLFSGTMWVQICWDPSVSENKASTR